MVLLLVIGVIDASSGNDFPQQLHVQGGKAIYEAACAACHGAKGDGTPKAMSGFDKPSSFPHFDKCDETNPEFTRDHKASIRDGGPARGFSAIMPSFSGVLISSQIGFRWAKNLAPYNADETRRFKAYFDSMGPGSATLLTQATNAGTDRTAR